MVSTKSEGEQLIVQFKGTHNTVVNSIRRIILDEVPTFAIEDVEVVLNESPIYDETIAHRLGLIPIKTDLQSYVIQKDCSCSGVGCAMCEVKLSVSKEGAGFVYSSDIKSDDPAIVPAFNKIQITKLFGEKSLKLNLKAVLGTGREHAKWAPAHTYLRDSENGEVELIVESFGQLSNKDVYNNAIDILVKKIEDLEEKL